jgi:hypothetical protein
MCPDCGSACIGSKFRTFQNIFLSVMEIEGKVEMVWQAHLCTCFIIVIRIGFRALVQIFNWVEVPSFVSSEFTKQHGVF